MMRYSPLVSVNSVNVNVNFVILVEVNVRAWNCVAAGCSHGTLEDAQNWVQAKGLVEYLKSSCSDSLA